MEYVTLVNRTKKDLSGTWDGRQYRLKPGKSEFPRAQALAFKRQNPIMGTGMYGDQDTQYLIGIEDDQDDCSPCEQSKEISSYPMDRQSLPVEIKKGNNGIYSARDVQTTLPSDSTFVKP